ncbi:MAG: hypothetical protein UY07_C0021G0026 [Parcubacteria group bacterium GW2011_GWA1_47_8]|nr:MAG: hypothetical protein UY07_C0021G0026 [Parcubacteria group bacterium GW2011_GWA1_47_8]KKW08040.1 MAG: hypothetical protein UY42_C0001G0003 [Parcubacteria group bacterium GW2011_GWA2_49_16]
MLHRIEGILDMPPVIPLVNFDEKALGCILKCYGEVVGITICEDENVHQRLAQVIDDLYQMRPCGYEFHSLNNSFKSMLYLTPLGKNGKYYAEIDCYPVGVRNSNKHITKRRREFFSLVRFLLEQQNLCE